MSDPKTPKPLQQQLVELDEIIAWFDKGEFDLDEALKKFDQGVELAEDIKQRLGTLENKITVLKERFDRPAEL